MFRENQRVILPKSHGEKEGVITVMPKKLKAQSGLQQQTDRVKVSYRDGYGGMAEAWFAIGKLGVWQSPKDITAELEAKHQKKLEAVNAEKDREKLDWIEGKDEEVVKKGNDGQDIVEKMDKSTVTIEVTKDTDIQAEMKKSEASQAQPKSDDNSDSYVG